ncbi:MAG: hypothetical protein AAFU85_20965 [Planctomycetota bacterium]
MKPLHPFFFALTLFFGCDDPRTDRVPGSYPDFETAIEVIATTEDIYEAGEAAAHLYEGGIPAINALRNHLSDQRVIPSGFCTRSLNQPGQTMDEQALWSIQDMIEPQAPKLLAGYYQVLSRETVEQWLDRREDMSITGLQIEAASTWLSRAQRDFESSGSPHAQAVIELCQERLNELHSNK